MRSSRNRSHLSSSPVDTQVSVCVGPRPRFGRGFAPRCPCRTTASRALSHRSTSRSNWGRRNSTRGHRKPPSGAPAVTEHHAERVPRGGGGDAQEPPSAHASAWQANPCSSRAPSWASILLRAVTDSRWHPRPRIAFARRSSAATAWPSERLLGTEGNSRPWFSG